MPVEASTSPAPARVLIVDDDEGLLILMEEALRGEGYEVVSVPTGKGALRWLEGNTPDLLLLDLKLGDIDSAELIARLQGLPVRVPFVVVTGQGDERVAVDVMKRGALDYVMKDGAMLDHLPAVVHRAHQMLLQQRALEAARIEHARLEREVLAAGDRERHSIGADLHDGLGQTLTGLELMCTGLKADLAASQPETARRMDQMCTMLREAIMQTRYLAHGLVPVGEGPDGLQNSLSALVQRAAKFGSTRVTFTCDDPVEIDDAVAAGHLFRIAQEAVNNALKHARASEIVVDLRREAGAVCVEVSDDGAGMLAANRGSGAGLGLMRYRAGLIGAKFESTSKPGAGVAIRCLWSPHETYSHPQT